jgi:hypothetical protein
VDGTSEVVRIRGALDAALLDLRAVKDPSVPLLAAAAPLARSVALLYRALASTHDAAAFRQAVDEAAMIAQQALDPLQRSGSTDPVVVRSTRSLAEAVQGLSRPVRIPPGAGADLPGATKGDPIVPALRDEPRLLELRREVLEPAVPIALPEGLPEVTVDPAEPPPGGPVALEALLAEASRGAREADAEPVAPPPPPPLAARIPETTVLERPLLGEEISEEQLRFERAQHFFEDLGMMSLIRRPGPGAHWRSTAGLERRLLARVDAILACGTGVFPRLVRLLAESPLPDAELTWAAIVLHGMLSGDDMFDEVIRLVRVTDLAEPASFDTVAEALRFVPHPRAVPTLQGWLSESRRSAGSRSVPSPRAGAPGGRGAARPLEDDPELRREGARALSSAVGRSTRRRSSSCSGTPSPRSSRQRCTPASSGNRAAATTALHLLQEGRGEFARAALYAAIASGDESRPVFARAWAGPMTPFLVEALGWLGDLGAVEPLLAHLASSPAAVPALQRLLGASLTDADPDPHEPAPPFQNPWRPPHPFEVLSADAEVWRAWWRKHAPRRRGEPGCAGDGPSPRRRCSGRSTRPPSGRRTGAWPTSSWRSAPGRTRPDRRRLREPPGAAGPGAAERARSPDPRGRGPVDPPAGWGPMNPPASSARRPRRATSFPSSARRERCTWWWWRASASGWWEASPSASRGEDPSGGPPLGGGLAPEQPARAGRPIHRQARHRRHRGGRRHLPGERPVRELEVGVRVGPLQKIVRVLGLRAFFASLGSVSLTPPQPFVRQTLRWEDAYGGMDTSDPRQAVQEPRNPCGRGLAIRPESLVGQPAPHVEDPQHPYTGPRSRPPPAGLAPLGPHFAQRLRWAGTMDQRWADERCPLPPADFDDRFNHCAVAELTSPKPLGKCEPVECVGLHPAGPLRFALPPGSSSSRDASRGGASSCRSGWTWCSSSRTSPSSSSRGGRASRCRTISRR